MLTPTCKQKGLWKHIIPVRVKWTKSPFGWCKLNYVGLSLRNPGIAGSGGVSCDRNGSWIRGYLDQRCFSWTARNGLQVAISLGISLLVNFDAQILLYMLISLISLLLLFMIAGHSWHGYLISCFIIPIVTETLWRTVFGMDWLHPLCGFLSTW